MEASVLLGCQGWSHPAWADSTRAGGATEIEMLRSYSNDFTTVEVAATFSGIPPTPLLESWRDAVPDGFQFALKVPQQITHEHRFVEAGHLLDRFLERVAVLGARLGPLLLAMPVGFKPTNDAVRTMKSFVHSLPAGFSWALECRRSDWLTNELFGLLSRRNVTLVLSDDRWISRRLMLDLASEPTADFSYVRWSPKNPPGRNGRPGTLTPKQTLSRWSPAITELRSRVSTVYGYVSRGFGGDQFPGCVTLFQEAIERESTPWL